ncbi:MAG: dTDP-4-dehydrorhamnose 3,5-epimerase family protein [Candidatus Giovannonibacteria bacterium]|nr:dTDP-4-dehydrorhamnose 3,5-epimerase family protein [Candidatus Giovannonibacteria bacterium]
MAKIISGDSYIDERGTLRFVNDFDFKGVKRFYQVENHRAGFIRAWHGHKRENKYMYVASGSVYVGVVDLETEEMQKFILSAEKPRILWIPPNTAHGYMNLEENTKIIFFSSSTLEESQKDDLRFPYDKWNIWDIKFY